MKERGNIRSAWLLGMVGLGVIIAGVYLAVSRFEGRAPTLALDLETPLIGAERKIQVAAADSRSGLKRVWVGILQNGKELALLERDFPAAGILGKGARQRATITVTVVPEALGLEDGKALLRAVAVDGSWRGWGKGNRAYLEQEVVIDTTTPRISVLSRAHNINPGGAGVVVYRLSETCRRSGVRVNELFYPGAVMDEGGAAVYVAFFALRHDQEKGTAMHLEAEDRAGNKSQAGFHHYIRGKAFKQDTIRLSDRFFNWKMPEFEDQIPASAKSSLLDQFLYVNQTIRRENKKTLDQVTQTFEKSLLWEGPFGRLPASAPRAAFADQRRYVYQGKTVDQQVHMGVDLASVAQSPVPAANRGRVVFAGYLGIYGNTIVLDHGLGLFSMYAHLNRFSTEVGQMVVKDDIIGHTGVSGLAGGDHLHYSMLVHQTFVNPIEWWDADWIRNNVSSKLAQVDGGA